MCDGEMIAVFSYSDGQDFQSAIRSVRVLDRYGWTMWNARALKTRC